MLHRYSKILVTGGAGFIGRRLVNALLSLGKRVVILDNLSAAPDHVLPGATLIRADVRDLKAALESAEGAEVIFHAAANANGTRSVEDPRFDFATNALGTFNVLEAALRAKVKRFIYVSSASVYGRPQWVPLAEEHPTDPFVPYGASKLCGELYCRAFSRTYGLAVVIARPFCVYGPGENPQTALVEVSRYLRWHLNERPIQVVGDMDRKTRDFVHVDDIVQGLLTIADRADAGETFNLGSGEETSMRRLVELIGSATGRAPTINEIAGITEDSYRLVADITKIRSLGYSPRISLCEGVERLASELGENPQLPGGATIFKRGHRGVADCGGGC
jgi:nucleoside-diphosphate-sugar epimerase